MRRCGKKSSPIQTSIMGGLGRDGLDGGVGVDAGHHGQEAGIAGADEAGAAVVAGDVCEQPSHSVVGVGAFVDSLGGRDGR